ncbi:MAG: indolepyruvate ferredoxin oxidoreductase subunit alpha [Dehalococcoidia bacterium]|nr:indolepyruvate ferredoxin oxidoreductase subunit alpha [Dehalococcoidia bacterium]
MSILAIDQPGRSVLMMGNEAIARGAIEAGVDFSTAYPGTPSSEIIESLARVAEHFGFYTEWSTNEIVALEAAAAASLSGLRAIVAMKQNGVNVCSDFLLTVNLTGTKGGLVFVVGDDPSAISSSNEQDSRNFARFADLPLLEPATFQEAKDMTRWAFELSESVGLPCMIRSVTRLSHSRGNVKLAEIPQRSRSARFEGGYIAGVFVPIKHAELHQKLEQAREEFEGSEFNWYVGPEGARFVIVTSGSGWLYSREAVAALGLDGEVGILKIGTTWPLPESFIVDHLRQATELLIVEEVDPFLEQNIKILLAEQAKTLGPIEVYGARSGHLPAFGDINQDKVARALAGIRGLEYRARDEQYAQRASELALTYVPPRLPTFCPGCPHRASLWAIKAALKLDGRDGFVAGDIGCYSLGVGPAGFWQLKTLHCMGAGIGLANGFGQLGQFAFDQPVVAVCGDSTFFHAAIPGLINARFNNSNVLMVVLDNGGTAMTGFQPHPGSGTDALGRPAPVVEIEEICKAIGVEVRVRDPFEVDRAIEELYDMLQDGGAKVMVFRRKCFLVESREKVKPRVFVDPEKCIGDDCGCARFCSRVFNCPGIIWDQDAEKAKIDEVVCTGCGVCATLCPQGAIVVDEG